MSTTMDDLPAIPQNWMLKPRKPRLPAQAAWSLAKNGTKWTDGDREIVKILWFRRDLTIDQLASRLERSMNSVQQCAHQMGLGRRPLEQSSGRGLRMERDRDSVVAVVQKTGGEIDESAPVPLKQRIDGVVLTRRLDEAWSRVELGADIAQVASDYRLTTVEILALRRWLKDANG